MSTYCSLSVEKTSASCIETLHGIVLAAEAIPGPLCPSQLPECLALLDRLEALLGYLDAEEGRTSSDGWILSRSMSVRTRLEAANEELYESVRSEILMRGDSLTFRRWLTGSGERSGDGNPRRGLGFDLRDEILSGVLQLCEPGETERPYSSEMVPYQPTPVRHILDLIAAAKIADNDVLIDLGSGLGHVPLLVSMLTGSRTLGVEFQPSYVASATECAERLNLQRAGFLAEDARASDLSSGTVFYLFSPFTGLILDDVVDRLRRMSVGRQIRVCSLGPCTRVLAKQTWLEPSAPPDSGRVAVFTSR